MSQNHIEYGKLLIQTERTHSFSNRIKSRNVCAPSKQLHNQDKIQTPFESQQIHKAWYDHVASKAPFPFHSIIWESTWKPSEQAVNITAWNYSVSNRRSLMKAMHMRSSSVWVVIYRAQSLVVMMHPSLKLTRRATHRHRHEVHLQSNAKHSNALSALETFQAIRHALRNYQRWQTLVIT